MKDLENALKGLNLKWVMENYEHELAEAARHNRTHAALLERLFLGEAEAKIARAIDRRLRAARLPGVHDIDNFDWAWPKKINADQIRHLFTLSFMRNHTNVVFIGTVGLGKTHLASALARHACMKRRNVLFASAVQIINDLAEAQTHGLLKRAMRRYVRPELLVIDELGYLPVDRIGAELLFQILGARYETASTVITTNRPYAKWAPTFGNDVALTSAVLDRVSHHCETIIITGKSYRMKDRLEPDRD
jgi:DNA replication protein DnaC